MTCAPATVTWPLVTSIVSTIASPTLSLITMSPVPTATSSSKVTTRLLSGATSMSSLAGAKVDTVGATVSAVVKFQLLLFAMPAKALPAVSVNAVAAIVT